MRASSAALRLERSQPRRIFTVTGKWVAPTTAAISAFASGRSRISAEPDQPPVTRFAGHPILMSRMSAPASVAAAAASAIQPASRPASCTTCGLKPSPTMRSTISALRIISDSLATISVTTISAPKRAAKRRNGRSVIPDIGRQHDRTRIAVRPQHDGANVRRRQRGFAHRVCISGHWLQFWQVLQEGQAQAAQCSPARQEERDVGLFRGSGRMLDSRGRIPELDEAGLSGPAVRGNNERNARSFAARIAYRRSAAPNEAGDDEKWVQMRR